MTPSDAAQILTLASVYDNRTFDEATSRVWADALTGLNLADCLDAVRVYYRRSRQWLMPVDVRDLARSMLKDRRELEQQQLDRLAIEQAETDPQVVADRVATIRQTVAAACRVPTESPHPKADDARGRQARKVACPWCGAPKGQACTNAATGKRSQVTHEHRLVAAGLLAVS